MKSILLKLLRAVIFIGLITISIQSLTQLPPPPPGGSSGGGSGTGGSDSQRNGAPIGSGLFILMGLGAAYSGYKGYRCYQKEMKKLFE